MVGNHIGRNTTFPASATSGASRLLSRKMADEAGGLLKIGGIQHGDPEANSQAQDRALMVVLADRVVDDRCVPLLNQYRTLNCIRDSPRLIEESSIADRRGEVVNGLAFNQNLFTDGNVTCVQPTHSDAIPHGAQKFRQPSAGFVRIDHNPHS